jgi:UDP-glucose 4-epimerase
MNTAGAAGVSSSVTVPSSLSGKRVLITGGAGFIGSHLATALREGCEVRVLDDFSTGVRSNLPAGVTVVTGDVRDEAVVAEAMTDVDVVFHEAAMVSVAASVERPAVCIDQNVQGTISVLEAARDGDARVVFASSAAVYGDPNTVPIPESAPKEPHSPYGVSKLAAEQLTRLYHDLHGVETVALRYFNVYGPGQTADDYSGVVRIFRKQARA